MAKTYRTAKGKTVDIQKLLNQNEQVRAVGNMNVNARGDLIDSQNKKVESKNKQVNRQYRKQISNTTTDEIVYSSKKAALEAQKPKQLTTEEVNNTENNATEIVKQYVSSPEPVQSESAVDTTEKVGLAAAIAKARQVKQEPLKSPRQIVKDQEGVKKI